MTIRDCGSCGKCCEGWLTGTIKGHDMKPDVPCHFYNNCKCTIYEDRPKDPCVDYNCAWIEDEIFPDWMRPDQINVIITHKPHPEIHNLSYYDVTEAGSKIDSTVLNWLMLWAFANTKNVIYEVGGEVFRIGNPDFINMMDQIINAQLIK